jgi:hypothetical protein
MAELDLARAQMAMLFAFHILFAVAGMGMPVLMVIAEGAYLGTIPILKGNLASRQVPLLRENGPSGSKVAHATHRFFHLPRVIRFVREMVRRGNPIGSPQNHNEKFPVTAVGFSGKLAFPRIILRYDPGASDGRPGRRRS